MSGLRTTARAYDYGSHYGHRDSCRRVFWNTWWDPCRYDAFSNWSWYGGCSTFGWSLSFWHPWYWYRTHYWNSCYFDTWWYLRSRPTCVSTNYWWYPSSTYCPTYLYVPSSSVVYVEREPSPAPVSAEPEVVVAGSGVGDGGSIARVVETPDTAAARAETTETLAKKYVELGDFYFEAGRFADAADAYSRARSYSPDNASIHFALADASFATGDYHFAAFLIGEAVRLQPSIVSAEIDRRVYYGDPKLFEQQMDELNRYVEAKPYDAQAQLVLGYNLRFSGRPVAAAAAFRRVLQVSPENRAAAAFLAALEPAGSEATIR
ncbi:MAG: tetratricopeptide repeat protein [Planctomycetes bacterium]|nr:tetratricopeptide repeat protein [Planctomycetota bacterium]